MKVPVLCLQNGGYGDLLFAQKFAHELQRYFDQSALDVNVFIVAVPETVNDMQRLGLMEEFKVPVATPNDVFTKTQDPNDEFQIDYMVVAPSFVSTTTFDWDGSDMFGMNGYSALNRRGNLHKGELNKNVCYVGEYNSNPDRGARSLHSQFFGENAPEPDIIKTGIFKSDENSRILTSSEQVRNKILGNADSTLKEQLLESEWNTIKTSKVQDKLPRDFYLEYSSNYKNSSTKRYLEILLPLSDEKQQDDVNVLCIGDREKKITALEKIKDKIIQQGFTKVEFVNLETNEIEIIHEAKTQSNEKVYKVFYVKSVPHNVMLSLINVSDKFIGVTGDQSLSEAISMLDKVVYYERLNHKVSLCNNYQDFILSKCPKEILDNMKQLLYGLVNYEQEVDVNALAKLIADPDIQNVLYTAQLDMAQNCSLANQLGEIIVAKHENNLTPLVEDDHKQISFQHSSSPKKPEKIANTPVETHSEQKTTQKDPLGIRSMMMVQVEKMADKQLELVVQCSNDIKMSVQNTPSLKKSIEKMSTAVISLHSLISSAQSVSDDGRWLETVKSKYLESIDRVISVVMENSEVNPEQIQDIKKSVGVLMSASFSPDAPNSMVSVKSGLAGIFNVFTTSLKSASTSSNTNLQSTAANKTEDVKHENSDPQHNGPKL